MSLVINITFLVRIRYEYSHQEGGFYMALAKEQLRQMLKENDKSQEDRVHKISVRSFNDEDFPVKNRCFLLL